MRRISAVQLGVFARRGAGLVNRSDDRLREWSKCFRRRGRGAAFDAANTAFRCAGTGHAPCVSLGGMRVLEARFHSRQGGGEGFIVVAHVVWSRDRDRPDVQPSPSLMGSMVPATMLAKLQYLVESSAPETFTRLMALKSQFWSFVDVTPSRGT